MVGRYCAMVGLLAFVYGVPSSVRAQHAAARSGVELDSEDGQQEPQYRRQPWLIAVGVIGFGVGTGLGLMATWDDRREGARIALQRPNEAGSCQNPPCDVHVLQKKWESLRRGEYVLAGLGAPLATAGIVTMFLGMDRREVPWWLSMMYAGAGVALSVPGVIDLARGDACDVPEKVRCAAGQQRRDRGAFFLLEAVPFFAMPITQGIRRLIDPVGTTEWSIFPGADSLRAFSLNARIQL